MSNYLELIEQAEDLLKQLLDDTEHGCVTLKGCNEIPDVEICKPNDFNNLTLGSVISIGVCEYFLADDMRQTKWVNYDLRRILTYQEMYIELVQAQEENIPVMLRYRGA